MDKACESRRFKWIVSSRNQPDIEQRLNLATCKVRLCLELNERSIAAAVATYISSEVDRLTELKKYNKETRDYVQDYLSSNAQDTFLWVSLVCYELADESVKRRHTRKKLSTFPPGLDSLYRRMLDQISSLNDADICKEMLAVVSAVYRPITL